MIVLQAPRQRCRSNHDIGLTKGKEETEEQAVRVSRHYGIAGKIPVLLCPGSNSHPVSNEYIARFAPSVLGCRSRSIVHLGSNVESQSQQGQRSLSHCFGALQRLDLYIRLYPEVNILHHVSTYAATTEPGDAKVP